MRRIANAQFPTFVFERQRHVEIEADFDLAGLLIVDLPKSAVLSDDEQCLVKQILNRLIELRQSDKLPDDVLLFGWRNGRKPPNAVNTKDSTLMSAWAERSLRIVLRLDQDGDTDRLRLDEDALRRLGIVQEH